jgi:HEAT repeat protein
MGRAWVSVVAVLAICVGALAWAQEADPEKALRSKDPEVRLAAVEEMRTGEGEKHEKLLVGALADKDWEVAERAAVALFARGSASSVPTLVKFGMEAPTRRMRMAAARTLGKLGPGPACAALAKFAAGKESLRALELIAAIAPLDPEPDKGEGAKALDKAFKSKEPRVRTLAARGLGGFPAAEREATLVKMLADPDAGVRAAALAAVEDRPEGHYLQPLLAVIDAPELADVLERRVIRALRACVKLTLDAGREEAATRMATAIRGEGAAPSPAAAARRVRLARALGDLAPEGSPVPDAATAVIQAGLEHTNPAVRAAAIHAGVELRRAAFLEAAPKIALRDTSARVRLIALRDLVAALGVKEGAGFNTANELLSQDPDPGVREEAAVLLAAEGNHPAAVTLARALSDPVWSVAACAAVSLGKTRDAAGIPPLIALASHADWRLRGAAVVGLSWMRTEAAVPPIIAALGDGELAVRRSAYVFLKSLTTEELPEAAAPWQTWWTAHGGKVKFPDTEEVRKRREKYGYASSDADVFDSLDVVVLESRGDHIESLLARLGIKHRLTQAAKIPESAVHPFAVYVSNCTGEIEAKDVERLQWFVRTGGYLFGSCWSLSQTIEQVFPGVVRKFETGAEVLDDVVAEPAQKATQGSAYLKGVFDPLWTPIYHLEGSHLIEVLDPERCEVLIDSPECLARWGCGNLAAYFRAGHGLILDSANHFDLQGLEVVQGLKTAQDRQAYAFDHMGLDYATWRKTQGEKWWDNALKAAAQVPDLSAFRFLTNFVRQKRLSES